jgi:putative ABC transport system permease protein
MPRQRLARFLEWLDPRPTARALGRAPAFTVAAVATFALGIGVNSAIFGAADAVLVDPLPAVDARSLLSLETDVPGGALRHARVSPQNVWELSDRHDVFRAVGGYRLAKVTVRDAGRADEIDAASTAGGFFEALAVRPLLGRVYDAREAETRDQRIVVLSYDFWRARLGSDSSIIGRSLVLDDSSYRIVGVLPPGASYPRVASVWTPHALEPYIDLDRSVWASIVLTAIARPQPGVTDARIRRELDQEIARIREVHPELRKFSVAQLVTRPLVEALAGEMRPILFAILVCGGLVLLMACANVASLQLVRVSSLSREIAVRAALGASRWSIARQIVLESALIAILGGVAGVMAGASVIAVIRRSSTAAVVSLDAIRLDPPVVLTLFVVIVVAGAISSVASLRASARIDPGEVLRASTRSASAGKRRDRFLRGVVVTQLALAIVLLLGATTAVRSLARLMEVRPGFDPVGVTTVRMILPSPRYSPLIDTGTSRPSTVTLFYDQLVQRLRHTSGIVAVGLVTGAPFGYVQSNEHKVFVPLANRPRSPSDPFPDFWRVSDDYFRAMGIPLRAGRTFTETDDSRRAPVVVIDDALARRLFGEKSALGAQISTLGQVVGVVGAVKKADLSAGDDGSVYLPVAPFATNDLTLVVRSSLSASNVASAVHAAVRSLDPTLAVGDVSTIVAGIERSATPQRLGAKVVASFALLSLSLALVGICGVMLYGVSQRGKEFGIRLALGATPETLQRLVLGEGARLSAIGLSAGAAIYWVIAGVARAMIFGISPRDPITMVVSVAALALAALGASYLPAFRAGRVDPIRSLSSE